jgi:hypothetical protein
VTAPYSVGDKVSIEWRRKVWLDGEVIQRAMNNDAVCVLTTSGKRWVYPGQLKAPSAARRSLKLATPDVSEEADSFEAARERSTGSVKAELVAVPKAPKPFRSSTHLADVRAEACCVCGSAVGIHAHHLENEGRGRKCADTLSAPLCGEHHRQWHDHGHFDDGDRTTALLTMWMACARVLATRLEAL